MSGEPQLTCRPSSDDQVERLAIEDVGRVNDRRRIAVRHVAGRQCPADFPCADRVDQHAVAANEIENRQIRASFLGVADHIERPQIVDPLGNLRGVVDIQRRAEPAGEIGNGDASDLASNQSGGHAIDCNWDS